jgi:hypothetical protein
MMNFLINNKLRITICCVAFGLVIACSSCKKEAQLVEFDLIPVSTEELLLDNILDTTINGVGYFSDTILLNNNFFRAACEQNGIKPDEVDSIYVNGVTVQCTSSQIIAGQTFSNVTIAFLSTTNQLDTVAHINSYQPGAVPVSLQTDKKNLKVYFSDLFSTLPVFFSDNIPFSGPVGIKYDLSFHVKGYSRQ